MTDLPHVIAGQHGVTEEHQRVFEAWWREHNDRPLAAGTRTTTPMYNQAVDWWNAGAAPRPTADDLLRAYILDHWRNDNPDHADCTTLHVISAETAFALFYDTGVEGVAFTAELACDHRAPFDYEFGELGELPDILEEMAKREGGKT